MKVVFFLSAFLVSSLVLARPEIRVHESVELKTNEKMTLGKLSHLRDFTASQLESISQIEVLNQYDLSQNRRMDSRKISGEIRFLIRNNELLKSLRPRLLIPSTIEIVQAGSRIDRALVEKRILSAYPESQCRCRISVKNITLPTINPNYELIDWQVEVPNNLSGNFNIPIHMRYRMRGSRTEIKSQKLWISGFVSMERRMFVAKRSLSRSDRIQPQDIELKWVEVTYKKNGIPLKDELIGFQLMRGKKAGDPIFSRDLKRERVVRKGSLVKAITGNGLFEVAMNLKALSGGYIGDQVTLVNPSTNKKLLGKIISKGRVRVE